MTSYTGLARAAGGVGKEHRHGMHLCSLEHAASGHTAAGGAWGLYLVDRRLMGGVMKESAGWVH
jgi:hypothetical protein